MKNIIYFLNLLNFFSIPVNKHKKKEPENNMEN